MTRIAWNTPGSSVYQQGLDRGVLYPLDGPGVAWNGLIGVSNNPAARSTPLYYDGVKFNDVVTYQEFNGSLEAYTYPEEFYPYEGVGEVTDGMYVTEQDRRRFGLSFRTLVGDDLDPDRGYKINVLYNLLAIPEAVRSSTIGSNIAPTIFRWNITGVPIEIPGFSPTVRIIFDSRKMDRFMLQDIEAILYGDVDSNPTQPSADQLATFLRRWARFIVEDFGNGVWAATATVDGQIKMLTPDIFEITDAPGEWVDEDTYRIWSSPRIPEVQ